MASVTHSKFVSSEFVSLCQTQLRLLTQQISESSAAVYIADMTGNMSDAAHKRQHRNEPDFIPVISYPEAVDSWRENFERATAWAAEGCLPVAPLLPAADSESIKQNRSPSAAHANEPSSWPETLRSDQQIVVPLVYSDVVVGLMVAVKRDRAWKGKERRHVEGIAQSLAAGCVMEQRIQWLQHQLSDKRDLQSRQSEIFHNLLHQFRNPLTAVTTFGQLLVRRLEPEDPNQNIATGIVRESKRLREMVSHFDETVAVGDADLATETPELPSLPPASVGLLLEGNAQTATSQTADAQLSQAEQEQADLSQADLSQADPEQSGLGHALTLSAQYLPDILEPILAVTEIVATEKSIDIQAQVAADTPSVWGEEEALREVVSNLIDNAVKYSPPGAAVWVQTGVSRVEGDRHYQGVVVGDTGPGIPASDLDRLFERHYRGVQAHGDLPGTGLGLAIAQSLMEQMRGAIEVISPAAGTLWMPQHLFANPTAGAGTIFIVWLEEFS